MYVIRHPQSQTRAHFLACQTSPGPCLKNTHTRWCPRVRAYRHTHPPTRTDTCAPAGMPAHGRAPTPTYPRTRTHARTHGVWSLSTSPASSAGCAAKSGTWTLSTHGQSCEKPRRRVVIDLKKWGRKSCEFFAKRRRFMGVRSHEKWGQNRSHGSESTSIKWGAGGGPVGVPAGLSLKCENGQGSSSFLSLSTCPGYKGRAIYRVVETFSPVFLSPI